MRQATSLIVGCLALLLSGCGAQAATTAQSPTQSDLTLAGNAVVYINYSKNPPFTDGLTVSGQACTIPTGGDILVKDANGTIVANVPVATSGSWQDLGSNSTSVAGECAVLITPTQIPESNFYTMSYFDEKPVVISKEQVQSGSVTLKTDSPWDALDYQSSPSP